MTDARFEDGAEQPLRLRVIEKEGLEVIAALCQDAVFPASEISYSPRKRELAILLNRFRWENYEEAQAAGRAVERVQAVLKIDHVLRVASDGVERGNADQILSLLTLQFNPSEEPGGLFEVILAGDGGIRAEVEAVELTLTDVTKPYVAPSGKIPTHPEAD